MNEKYRQIITMKNRISFYEKCYAQLGYRIHASQKVKRNMVVTFIKDDDIEDRRQNILEEKLRMVELFYRKKTGFYSLYRNLFIHIALFCIQAAILFRLRKMNAHPQIMLQIGILLFLMILMVGFILKIYEQLKWKKAINRFKEEILSNSLDNCLIDRDDSYVISVLFTRGHNLFSQFVYYLSGRQYTHASIGLGNDTDTFYSFDSRGFREEHPSHRTLHNNYKDSLCYQFNVDKEDYCKIAQTIKQYKEQKSSFRYNLMGAIFSILHLYFPIRNKKVYFCSEFVTEQLKKIQGIELKQSANMYLPTHLAKALISQKNLSRVIVNEI